MGILTCFDAANGKQVYSNRIGGSYSASPIAADGKIYFTSEEGDIRVVKAGADYDLLATNAMGDPCMATPALVDGLLVVRTLSSIMAIGSRPLDEDAKQKAVEAEWKLRNGTWEPVSTVADGKERPVQKDRKFALKYKDEKYSDTLDDKVVGEGTSKVDPTQSPKTLDITPERNGMKGQTALAIYELKDDEMKVCMARPGKERPKEFESKPGSGHILMTFKRVSRDLRGTCPRIDFPNWKRFPRPGSPLPSDLRFMLRVTRAGGGLSGNTNLHETRITAPRREHKSIGILTLFWRFVLRPHDHGASTTSVKYGVVLGTARAQAAISAANVFRPIFLPNSDWSVPGFTQTLNAPLRMFWVFSVNLTSQACSIGSSALSPTPPTGNRLQDIYAPVDMLLDEPAVQRRDDVDDLTQEVLVVLFRELPKFVRQRGNLSGLAAADHGQPPACLLAATAETTAREERGADQFSLSWRPNNSTSRGNGMGLNMHVFQRGCREAGL